MKKLVRKVVLSSLALGISVVTLSTTTFAWYTSNVTASVNNVNGTTAGTTDSTLLISADGKSFSKSVDEVTYTVDGKKMVPLQLSKGKMVDLRDKEATTAASKGQYIQFSVFVKTTSEAATIDIPVYLKSLKVTNNGNSPKTYDALNKDASFTADAKTYAVDAARTLAFSILGKEGTTRSNAGAGVTTNSVGYSISNIYTAKTTIESNLSSTVDALRYYNSVMGLEDTAAVSIPTTGQALSKELDEETGTKITATTLKSKNVYELIFTVWMDGWDKYCFDACAGQTFKIDLKLTTSTTDISVFAAA